MAVNNKLRELFKDWQSTRNYSGFFKDGIIGEQDWNNKSPKIMFLLKENYSDGWEIDGGIDIRGGTNRQFFPNLARWKYLIEYIGQNNKVVGCPDDDALVDFLGGWVLSDVAYVNVKKSKGQSKSSNKMIQDFAVKDKDFLTKEIDIINPDIVICGGTFWSYHPIYDGNNNIECVANRVHKHEDRIILDFYHPGWRQCPGGYVGLYDKLKAILDNKYVLDLIVGR